MSKKSQKKGQTMDLGTFLAKKEFGDWADDVQELPTAPSASHGNEDYNSRGGRDYDSRGGGDRYNSDRRSDLPIPTMPPYTVYMGNLSYEVSERDITMFFGEEISVKGVRLPEGEDGQGRGFGYVEFADRPSIIAAVGMSGEKFMNRLVRINVAEEGKGKSGANDEKFATNWRTSMRASEPAHAPSGYNSTRDKQDGYGRGYGRDREGDSRSGFGRSTRDDDFNAMVSETGWRSRGAPAAIPPAAAPMVRRKLELAPRTLPDPVILITQEATPAAEEAPVAPRKSSVNPFGVAKPRDEAEIQRQFEERRKAREEEELKLQKAEAELKRKQEEEAREKADLQRKADQEQREKEAEAKRVAALAKAAAAAEKSTSTANNIHSTKKSVAVEPVVLPSNWRRQEDLPPVQPKFKGKPFAADQKTRTHGGARDKTDRAPMTVKKNDNRTARSGPEAPAVCAASTTTTTPHSRTPIQQEKPVPVSVKNAYDLLGDQDE
ncbi:hypothetical protein BASA50_006184 [Batrachochytrium salamandrivorans]|uniref:RRM domain-containing protein n=1 Tax=Batrachochytrium salamandrivorans TaxID=1357716 RepID=A0ABQ8FB05_9FUNG|nr:hypothetical protein BASA62_001935 [Batrachochytrium salamandrivorans]KAH6594922.1 hypothetical protein BASA50_006184 [Batrachochytrium salamandrivorans]KAH9267063.1 hypothetical protein BASA84_000852 [Batrachochytrium salamandrivorans]KAH9276565.1 hypothetical protein BASA83_000693 [Batrachochytrium salamandrivorans]